MPGYDAALQARLDRLWFRMRVPSQSDRLADDQRVLIREFQICCRARFGARLKAPGTTIAAENLVQVALVGPARLPADRWPDGIADAPTLAAIAAWEAGDLRCPIVFQQRHKTPGPPVAVETVLQGVFFPGEVATRGDAVWVRDFTGRYPIVPAGQDGEGLPARVIVGAGERRVTTRTLPATPTAPARKVEVVRWGNKADAGQRMARLTPEALAGRAWADMDAAERSTFRVIAAVAFIETGEALDAVNAWDTSALSIGPFQYTAFGPDELGKAELAAFLAYFRSFAPAEHDRYFGAFGIAAREAWSARLRVGNATFAAQLEMVADAAGRFAAPATLEERDWLRCWPVIHRIRHAVAESSALRTAMWNFSRQRLTDLLAAKWPGSDAAIGAAKMGDVFRSELLAALLLRMHVKRPSATLRKGGIIDALMRDAEFTTAVNRWKQPEFDRLAKALTAPSKKANAHRFMSRGLRENLRAIGKWSSPKWGGLATGTTFAPYVTGIPFPPAKEV